MLSFINAYVVPAKAGTQNIPHRTNTARGEQICIPKQGPHDGDNRNGPPDDPSVFVTRAVLRRANSLVLSYRRNEYNALTHLRGKR